MSSLVGQQEAICITVSDVSGQTTVRAAGIVPTSTVDELVQGLVPKMDLPTEDPSGRRLSYHVRLEREGRHLHATECVGDVLKPGDEIVLQPNIMAG